MSSLDLFQDYMVKSKLQLHGKPSPANQLHDVSFNWTDKMKLFYFLASLCAACDLGWCEIEENLVVTLQCTEECISEMKDCLVECDVGNQECELDCHWEQVQCAKGIWSHFVQFPFYFENRSFTFLIVTKNHNFGFIFHNSNKFEKVSGYLDHFVWIWKAFNSE